MNKEMDNHSFNGTGGHTGNSGLLCHAKPRLQPMRVQELLDLCNSDDDDSEDKDKDSASESDDDDLQPLSEDEEDPPLDILVEECEDTTSALSKENKVKAPCISEKPVFTSAKKVPVPLEDLEQKKRLPSEPKSSRLSDFLCYSESAKSMDNKLSESSCRKSLLTRTSSVHSESSVPITQARSSISNGNRRSNVKFEMPEPKYCSEKSKHLASTKSETPICSLEAQESVEKSKYAGSSVKSDSLIYPSKVQAPHLSGSKTVTLESQSYYSNEKHLPSASLAQPDLPAGPAPLHQAPTSSHLITDTPLKNNPPLGSSRPTPSLSHRSMFQTPQSTKFPQDYAKNHAQTPATIFGHWSQNHMLLTPLQARSAANDSSRPPVPSANDPSRPPVPSASDSSRPPGPSILGQQSASHDTPRYRSSEDKDRPRRKPLGEAIHVNQHSNEKSVPYVAETSGTTNSSGNHSNRAIPETITDSSVRKPIPMTHETKENKHPQQKIERSSIKEEIPRSKAPESIKELITACANGTVNEIRSEPKPKIVNVQTSESQGVTSARSSYSSRSNNPTPAAEKRNNEERKATVQSSVQSSIRRPNHGEIVTVKDKSYLVLGVLGAGMSGQVLRVQDLRSRELRAIKIVDLQKLDRDCAEGCVQEISMLHKLQAPCVVRMFDYEIKFPNIHVVMEMGDTDLRSLLLSMSERKKLPLTMILYYWTEMLTAVKHIHDNGVIHSDLKPANFLLVRGRLKLIDFGIASSMNPEMTSVVKNSPTGTVNYISPEALMDIGCEDSPNKVKYKISYKSDVWSLGCILYSLVYGYTPFHNLRHQWAKLRAITNPNPNISFPTTVEGDTEPLPPVLIDVMRKCLQHDPKSRPTVAQLLQVHYVPTRPISTPSVDIPSDMLLKIKNALTETEWRQFTNIMETKRNQC